MSNEVLPNMLRFAILILAQALIFNHINFLGYINPYPYIIFIALFPFHAPKIVLLLAVFFMGLSIDFFSDGGGVNTMACVIIGYIRPVLLKTSFGIGMEYNSIKIQEVSIDKKIIYLTMLILTHHIILFSLEIFSFTHIWSILKKTLYSGVFTLILSILFISIFNRKE